MVETVFGSSGGGLWATSGPVEMCCGVSQRLQEAMACDCPQDAGVVLLWSCAGALLLHPRSPRLWRAAHALELSAALVTDDARRL